METTAGTVVADNVRAEFARRRQNQGHLATVLGISRTAAHRRLTGEVAFDVDELQLLADHLGVTPSFLLGDQATAAAS